MTAKDNGYTRGREYLRSCRIEMLTFSEYRNLGIVDAKHRYRRKEKQDEYLLGWWQAGEQFLTLFKQSEDIYQTQKCIQEIVTLLNPLILRIEAMIEAQDDSALQYILQDAHDKLDDAQSTLDNGYKYLREYERRKG